MIDMQSLIIEIPMPPSSNQMYTPVNGRLIKSGSSRSYDKSIELIKLRKFKQLDCYKKLIKEDDVLKIDVVTIFPEKKFFTKQNKLRKFDASNRLKAIYDSVAKLIEHDDSKFIDGRVLKTYHKQDYETVFVKVTILDKALSFEEIKLLQDF